MDGVKWLNNSFRLSYIAAFSPNENNKTRQDDWIENIPIYNKNSISKQARD